jgi:hypothetical protein
MTERHPVRIVAHDDLRRSRLTVAFRVLLAIPHLIWAALFGIVVIVIAIINWFATLVRGQSPRGLHDFLGGYVRYVTRVEAYLFLAADPFPPFFTGSSSDAYPVDLEVDEPRPQNRWKTGFRLFLLLPAALVSGALAGGGGAAGRASGYGFSTGVLATTGLLVWFAALFTARAPRGLRNLSVWALGYSAQTAAYALLLTDRYPYSGPEGHLSDWEPAPGAESQARLSLSDDLRRSRLTVLFRLLLGVPHLIWLVLWSVVAFLAAIVNWVATLVRGRSPSALAGFLAAYVRYSIHVYAFLHLIGNPFPGFNGRAGSYPVDAEVPLGEPQNRWVTGFRVLLAVPAFFVGSALGTVLLVAAFLGWFASLVRAEMPRGLRNAGAHALLYQAQLYAYSLVLTDRYPFSGPVVEQPAGGSP